MQEPKKPRKKKCKWCKDTFQPERQFQEVCQPFPCSFELSKEKARAKQKKKDKARLQDLQPLSHWLDETQKVFNAFIRARDAGNPCISCGTPVTNEWCAGHYRTRGAAGHLRYNEQNVHRQCNRYCNQELSGNIINYRPRLIEKIGVEAVEALENDNSAKKWTRDELEAMRASYRKRTKELEAGL